MAPRDAGIASASVQTGQLGGAIGLNTIAAGAVICGALLRS